MRNKKQQITISSTTSVVMCALVLCQSAYSRTYKCINESGKASYQALPCEKDEESKQVKNNKTISASIEDPSTNAGKPSGNWFVKSKPAYRARLSASGRFMMTDHEGGQLSGTWKARGKGEYQIKASYLGVSFPVSMRYDKESDELLLSKPGFPTQLQRYSRR